MKEVGPLLFEETAEFSVEIEYRLTSLGSDVDNLTKPVLDNTLFAKPPNPNAAVHTGMLSHGRLANSPAAPSQSPGGGSRGRRSSDQRCLGRP